ncbi:MAG: hypothetical protein H7Z40_03215 [Phycisphaerae bacterium]|nr:hypothetical protein [Gemmatimonadaceae bacterium]
MLTRITVPLLAAAVIIFFACGPHARAVDTPSRAATKKIAGVVSTLNVDTSESGVHFTLAVQNGTNKQVELDFPNGRTHDFVVLDESGREVWRWSASRMFTQAVQNRLLDSRDSVVYEERWNAPAGTGKFTVVAVLNSKNYPMEKRVDFALQ